MRASWPGDHGLDGQQLQSDHLLQNPEHFSPTYHCKLEIKVISHLQSLITSHSICQTINIPLIRFTLS